MSEETGYGPIATHLRFENEHVRAWEMNLAPGQMCGMHRHTLDYVLYIESGLVDGSATDLTARGPVPNTKKGPPPPPTSQRLPASSAPWPSTSGWPTPSSSTRTASANTSSARGRMPRSCWPRRRAPC